MMPFVQFLLFLLVADSVGSLAELSNIKVLAPVSIFPCVNVIPVCIVALSSNDTTPPDLLIIRLFITLFAPFKLDCKPCVAALLEKVSVPVPGPPKISDP